MPRMTFRLTADCTFAAEDIDDALLVLAAHFISIVRTGDMPDPMDMTGGQIKVEPFDAGEARV